MKYFIKGEKEKKRITIKCQPQNSLDYN